MFTADVKFQCDQFRRMKHWIINLKVMKTSVLGDVYKVITYSTLNLATTVTFK
jgi:hypothetical protein